jgi:hypothetical protein
MSNIDAYSFILTSQTRDVLRSLVSREALDEGPRAGCTTAG